MLFSIADLIVFLDIIIMHTTNKNITSTEHTFVLIQNAARNSFSKAYNNARNRKYTKYTNSYPDTPVYFFLFWIMAITTNKHIIIPIVHILFNTAVPNSLSFSLENTP